MYFNHAYLQLFKTLFLECFIKIMIILWLPTKFIHTPERWFCVYTYIKGYFSFAITFLLIILTKIRIHLSSQLSSIVANEKEKKEKIYVTSMVRYLIFNIYIMRHCKSFRISSILSSSLLLTLNSLFNSLCEGVTWSLVYLLKSEWINLITYIWSRNRKIQILSLI